MYMAFNAKYNVGKFGIDGEWVKASGLSDSDVWNVGVKWGDYKINKKNSWDIRLDYFDQAKMHLYLKRKNMNLMIC